MAIFGGGKNVIADRAAPPSASIIENTVKVFFYEKGNHRLDHEIPKVYYAVRFIRITDFAEFRVSALKKKKKLKLVNK